MKFILIVGDGMADYSVPELGNKTPLQVAYKPNMDSIAAQGKSGLIKTVPFVGAVGVPTLATDNVSPSISESFWRTLILTTVFTLVDAMSFTATGGSFTELIVTLTVAVEVPPWPSEIE